MDLLRTHHIHTHPTSLALPCLIRSSRSSASGGGREALACVAAALQLDSQSNASMTVGASRPRPLKQMASPLPSNRPRGRYGMYMGAWVYEDGSSVVQRAVAYLCQPCRTRARLPTRRNHFGDSFDFSAAPARRMAGLLKPSLPFLSLSSFSPGMSPPEETWLRRRVPPGEV